MSALLETPTGQQSGAPWFAEPASPIIDCGWYGDSKSTKPHDTLIVNARGREVSVPLGVTLILHHVQKAIQAELGLGDQSFEIYDVHGTRLRTDQDLREAVMGGRIPLAAQCVSDTTQRLIEDQREELAQIICALIQERCDMSDVKLETVCQQVDSLKVEMQEHKKDAQSGQADSKYCQGAMAKELLDLRNHLNARIEALKELMPMSPPLKDLGKVDLTQSVGDTVPTSTSTSTSMEPAAQLDEHFQRGLHRLEQRLDEMTNGIGSIMAEHEDYLQRICSSSTEEVQAVADRFANIDVRLLRLEKDSHDRYELKQRLGFQGIEKKDPGSTGNPLTSLSKSVSNRIDARSPMRRISKDEPPPGALPGRSVSPIQRNAFRELAYQASSVIGVTSGDQNDLVCIPHTQFQDVVVSGRSKSRERPPPSKQPPLIGWTAKTVPVDPSNASIRRISVNRNRDGSDAPADTTVDANAPSTPVSSTVSTTGSASVHGAQSGVARPSATQTQAGQQGAPIASSFSSPAPLKRSLDHQSTRPANTLFAHRPNARSSSLTGSTRTPAGSGTHAGGGHQVGVVFKTT